MKSIVLDVGAHVLAIEGRVTGKERDVVLVREDKNGHVLDTEKKVTEHVPDTAEWERADALLNKLRAQLKRFATRVAPVGFITDEVRAAAFRDATAKILEEIDLHNRFATFHKVVGTSRRAAVPDVLVAPLGTALNSAVAQQLSDTVRDALEDLKVAVATGDVRAAAYWIQRQKSLAGLMPSIIAHAVQDAVNDAPRLLKELRDGIEAGSDPVAVGGALDVSLIDTALALVLAPPVSP